MSERYMPELGQAFFGAPTGEFEMPAIGESAVRHVLDEMRRVYGNRHQEAQDFGDNDGFALPEGALGPEISYRSYVWCMCDGEDPKCDCHLPNLTFGGVEVRWYKYFGRGMSCNRDMTPNEWDVWLNEAMEHLRSLDVRF